jgi:hypothetical protein
LPRVVNVLHGVKSIRFGEIDEKSVFRARRHPNGLSAENYRSGLKAIIAPAAAPKRRHQLQHARLGGRHGDRQSSWTPPQQMLQLRAEPPRQRVERPSMPGTARSNEITIAAPSVRAVFAKLSHASLRSIRKRAQSHVPPRFTVDGGFRRWTPVDMTDWTSTLPLPQLTNREWDFSDLSGPQLFPTFPRFSHG